MASLLRIGWDAVAAQCQRKAKRAAPTSADGPACSDWWSRMDGGAQRVPLVPVADPLEVPDELPLVLVPVPVPDRELSVGVTVPEPETEPDPDPVPLPAAVQPASPQAMAKARAAIEVIVLILFSSSGALSPRSADMNPAIGGRPSICNRRSNRGLAMRRWTGRLSVRRKTASPAG
ncbi:hypothetical protein [Cupriavidus gilardii]|uniref:hypothetical protein n=1 Tax=Cupriavidus gilardii TaxID=82541 RepID=UPI0015810508|nr:hypothetical protein [Cupriavidus gilardii]MCT9072816.1 hypothetical protein [Cupriavidus gilardii]QKS64990.1 hypothetical protein FOB47_25150 [Cupriavidus gilardii]